MRLAETFEIVEAKRQARISDGLRVHVDLVMHKLARHDLAISQAPLAKTVHLLDVRSPARFPFLGLIERTVNRSHNTPTKKAADCSRPLAKGDDQ